MNKIDYVRAYEEIIAEKPYRIMPITALEFDKVFTKTLFFSKKMLLIKQLFQFRNLQPRPQPRPQPLPQHQFPWYPLQVYGLPIQLRRIRNILVNFRRI